MKLVKDKTHNHWMSLAKEIKSSATSISKTSDLQATKKPF